MTDEDAAIWSYRPGPWYAVFGPNVTLLLPRAQRDRVIDLWALIEAGASFDEVLDGLLAAGLSGLPGFVLVSTADGPTRVLVRGVGVSATVRADEEITLEGPGGGTWAERTVAGVTSLAVTVPAEEDAEASSSAEQADYAIPGGLVQVGRIDLPAATRPEPRSEPQEPIAAPALSVVPDADEGAEAGEAEPEKSDDADIAPAADQQEQPEQPGWESTEPIVPEDDALQAGEESEETPYGWMTPWGTPPGADAPAATPEPSAVADPSATQDPPADEASAPAGGDDTDHDGLTSTGNVRGDQRPQTGFDDATPAPDTPVATLVISDGQQVVVDRPVIIGRAPEARRFTATEQPVLITVPSRLHEISSTHVEVRPGSGADHGSAVVTDMGSTNGTVLEQPGLEPEDLKPGVAVQLVPGAVINLGDGITIQVTRP